LIKDRLPVYPNCIELLSLIIKKIGYPPFEDLNFYTSMASSTEFITVLNMKNVETPFSYKLELYYLFLVSLTWIIEAQ